VFTSGELPDPNNRERSAEGAAVLFPTETACQTNFWFTADPPFLKLDALIVNDGELDPAVAVAVEIAGS
jgi:hypothetical protein